jgi:hypothetical protein
MDAQHPNKQEDDFEAASRATAEEYDDYSAHSASYSAPKHKLRKVLIGLLVLLLLAAIGFAVYWFVVRKDAKPATNDSTSNSNSQQSSKAEDKSAITTETEHHASGYFTLEFDYPKDWKVVDENGSGKITARSPALELKDGSGQTITGQALLIIRNKQQPMPEFDKGNSIAVRESEKIAYTKPSSVQRGSTYLSFLQFASSKQSQLDGLYITGDVGYQKDQAIPKADFTPVDPVISVSFVKCTDESCSGEGTAVGISASMWENSAFAKPLKSMLQSLTIN